MGTLKYAATEQRFIEAYAYHQAALQRVATTPPPSDQKFTPGTRVKIAENLGSRMRHFPSGKLATVRYTYAHAFGRVSALNLTQYCLDIDGIGEVSWYDEHQLSFAEGA